MHNLAVSFDSEVRKKVLSAYFLGLHTLESNIDAEQVPRPKESALLTAALKGEASVYAIFGGQGTNEVYFDELQSLYDIYRPYVEPLIRSLTTEVFNPLAEKADFDGYTYYAHGMDVISWLDGTNPKPSVDYFASIPISFPLIGLTQLVQYAIIIRISNLTPGDLRSRIGGATGHSQGLVSAVAISASDSFESFETNTLKALKWLFYCGLRGQEAFPTLAIEPSIVADSIDGGEGVPTPMLNVAGLSLQTLEAEIKKTNKHLPENSQLGISLYNGPKINVVTGPPRALYGLATALRKIRAPSGADQSKIPHSQRKAVFSMRFLAVGVPYHSHYLKDAADKLCEEDLKGEELWTSDELKIAVFHTESGEKEMNHPS